MRDIDFMIWHAPPPPPGKQHGLQAAAAVSMSNGEKFEVLDIYNL